MISHTNITIRALLEAAKYNKKCLHCKKEIKGVRAYNAKTKYCDDVCRGAYTKDARSSSKAKIAALKKQIDKSEKQLKALKTKVKQYTADEMASLRKSLQDQIAKLKDQSGEMPESL